MGNEDLLSAAPRRTFGRWLALGLVGFLFALLVCLSIAGREGPDRRPRPDALEYAEIAGSLSRGEGLSYPLLHVHLPPRYPPGAPIALAPASWVFGPSGAWIAAAVWTALGAVLAGVLGHLVAGRLGGAMAYSTVALSPLGQALGGLAMSEGPVQALVGLSLVTSALAHWRQTARPWALWISGVAVGWLLLTRLPLLAFALAPLAAALLAPRPAGAERALWIGARVRTRVGPLCAVAVPVALFGLLLLGWQWTTFGHPARTGYHLWAPEVYVQHSHLVLSTHWWREVLEGHWTQVHPVAYARGLAGLGADPFGGPLWSPWVGGFALVGLAVAWRGARRCPAKRALAAGSLAGAALVAFHLLYAWQDLRFLVPLLPVVGALFGLGVSTVLGALRGRGAPRFLWPLGLALLWILCFADPARRLAERALERRGEPPSATTSATHLGQHLGDGDVCVVDLPAPIAQAALPRGVELVFADLDSADPHLVRTRLFSIRDRSGNAPRAVALAALGSVEIEGLERLAEAARSGRRVFWLSSEGEGAPGVGMEALLGQGWRLEPFQTHGLSRLERLVPPG